MKLKFIISTLVVILIGLTAAFVFKSSAGKIENKLANEIEIEVESDVNETEEINSESIVESGYSGVDIATEIIEERYYQMAIHYPDLGNEYLNGEIRKYINLSKKTFLNEIDENLEYLKKNEHSGTLSITFDIHEVADDIYSIVIENESFIAGANGKQSSKVVIVNSKESQFIYPYEILKDDKDIGLKIQKILLEAFEKSSKYNDMFFEEELFKWIEDERYRVGSIFITRESLIFKFDKYEVTAGAAGSPEIIFPINEVRDIIKEEWLEIIYKSENSTIEDNNNDVLNINNQNENQDAVKEEKKLGKKKVALTFDDGPHPKNTIKILELLADYDMNATFFMLGNRIDFYPNIVKKVHEGGHEIGNHTWSHKKLTKLSEQDIRNEIDSTDKALEKAIGEKATVFRPPYGSTNKLVKSVVDLPSALWTIDTLDWKNRNPDKILYAVKKNLKPNAIILMHDIHGTTVEAVALVLEYLESEGYTSVKVSEILNDKN